jgi:hypothetical protein
MGTVKKFTLDNVESPNSEKRSVQRSGSINFPHRILANREGKEKRRSAGQSNYKVQAISRHHAQVGERISHQGPNSSMR